MNPKPRKSKNVAIDVLVEKAVAHSQVVPAAVEAVVAEKVADAITEDLASGKKALVKTKSAWASKINWTQVIGVVAMLGAMFGLDLDAQTQAAIVAGIVAVQGVATVIFKTWFTSTVTPESSGS